MKTKVIFIAIIVLAIVLRLLFFESVTFFYDQARDAFSAMEIFQGNLIKIAGPASDIPGVNHGPLYWYLIAPFLSISGGNILLVRFILILINVTGIFFIYDLTRDLFKNKWTPFVASFLYAVSFEAVSYGRWLSNPGPALVTSLISFWSLFKFINGKKWGLITLLVSWAVSIQLEIFMVYQIIPFFIIWMLLSKRQDYKSIGKHAIFAISGFLLFISTYIISEIKYNFRATTAFLGFFKTQIMFKNSFVNLFDRYVDRLTNVFFLNIWGINLFLAGLTTIFVVYFCFKKIGENKQKNEFVFLTVWLLSSILINFFEGPDANFINLGILAPAIIITSYILILLEKKWKALMFFVLIVIFLGNLNLILSKNNQGDILFTVQSKMILNDEMNVVDWTYKEAEGKPFKINTYTQPLFINSTWAFLYNWYGRSKYKYMPIWWGEHQVGVAGANVKFGDPEPTDIFFFIIEPGAGGDDDFLKGIKIMENQRSKVVKVETIGSFTIQKRVIIKEQTYTSGDMFNFIKSTNVRNLGDVE